MTIGVAFLRNGQKISGLTDEGTIAERLGQPGVVLAIDITEEPNRMRVMFGEEVVRLEVTP